VPFQTPAIVTFATCNVPSVVIPALVRPGAGPLSSTPARSSSPLGCPLVANRSPLIPATVACADACRSIAESVSVPASAFCDSAGRSA